MAVWCGGDVRRFRWIEANGRVEFDASGRAVRFPGVLLDIEDRRRTEAERDRVAVLLRSFIEAVPGVRRAAATSAASGRSTISPR